MAKGTSIAPMERVNIRYKSHTGDAQEEVELPLKILVLGDYTGQEDPRLVEERRPIRVNPDNFEDVLGAANVQVSVEVPNRLAGVDAGNLCVNLKVESLQDLSPDGLVAQVPELREMMAIRDALSSLRGPLGNRPAFRSRLQQALANPGQHQALIKALGAAEPEDVS